MTETNDNNNDHSAGRSSSLTDVMNRLVEKYGSQACRESLELACRSHAMSTSTEEQEEDDNKNNTARRRGSETTNDASLLGDERTRDELERAMSLQDGIIDASFDAIFMMNGHGIIQKVNKAALLKFGYDDASELVGQNIAIICGGDLSMEKHNAFLDRYRLTRESHIIGSFRTVPARRKDGSEFPCQLGINVTENKHTGELLMCGFIRDLTTEKEMQLTAELNESIIDASFDAMFLINGHGIIQKVNRAAITQFGYENAAELLGQNISLVCGDAFSRHHDRYLKKYRETGESHIMGDTMREVSARRKDGSEFPCQLGIDVVTNQMTQEMLICGFIRDLTTQKQAELSMQLNDSIIDAAFDAMVLIDGHGIIQKVNKAAIEQFGYDHADELLGQNISKMCGDAFAVHHDDYLKRYRETGESRIIGSMREVSARRKDGSEFPCKLGIDVVTNKLTEEMLICGFIRDLTTEKQIIQSHADLERSMKLNDAIIDAAFNAMFLINGHGIIEKVNQAALTQFGYDSKEELVGRNIHCICGAKFAPHHDKYLERFRATRESHIMGSTREVSARRKDGTEFPCQLGINCVENEETGELRMVGFVRDLSTEKRAMDLAVEARAAEQLLLNMLPKEIALRLKNDPQHLADHHASATILFADIVGFTSMSSSMKPIEVVELLNNLFSRFDELVDRYALNKVKTIGDCYMVTSVPGSADPGPKAGDVCSFGLDMIQALHAYNDEHPNRPLDLRVGVHSGPVVAGVVGTKRFLYDIWGDAVNLASRMESTGIPGRIQVTPQVVELVPEKEFTFERRGFVHVKGKGEMETYFLLSRHSDGSKHYRTE